MLKNKKSVEKIYDKPLIKQPKGDSFYGNLDTFQKETQKLT